MFLCFFFVAKSMFFQLRHMQLLSKLLRWKWRSAGSVMLLRYFFVKSTVLVCRRDPNVLTQSKKTHPSTKKDASNESVAQKKPKASRHLLLIRHGQYSVNGETDDQRTLTPLGCLQLVSLILQIFVTNCCESAFMLQWCSPERAAGGPVLHSHGKYIWNICQHVYSTKQSKWSITKPTTASCWSWNITIEFAIYVHCTICTRVQMLWLNMRYIHVFP